ncbi:MAG: hypothetical protein ACU837_16395 [Gammaproteobacteria bacterium]
MVLWKYFKGCSIVFLLLGPTACTPPIPPPITAAVPGEQAVTMIPLSGDLQSDDAEISGLTWYRDYLLLLPQYPDFGNADGDGRIFALAKTDIVAFLDGRSKRPLTPKIIPFYASGVIGSIPGYQGFEALAVERDRVYLTLEARNGGMMGYLVTGKLKPDLSELRLDAQTPLRLLPQAAIDNAANEALLVDKGRLLSFYENNGGAANPNPVATVFALPNMATLPALPMPNIEYRLTDATAADADGKFWVVNYFYPGDASLYPLAADHLAAEYRQDARHARLPQIERLLELQCRPGHAVRLTGTPPIQLQLDAASRNWEGIVRLDRRGFLLATDRHPHTLLGFVPMPRP